MYKHYFLVFFIVFPGLLQTLAFASESQKHINIQVGARPYFLVENLQEGRLKAALQACAEKPMRKSEFSIGHRGAPLQYPEHTRESYVAAARMGAGILECDVTFTKDKQLVCRHSQCDLHTTTNILATELAKKCSIPFTPADPAKGELAQAKCCTSDITLEEFKTLRGKMDGANSNAIAVKEYMAGTPSWRTDLYASYGTLMTHAESIALFKQLDVKMTPELKAPMVKMPFKGMSQQQYAQKMLDEYKRAGVPASSVWPQSFHPADIVYWVNEEPEFAKQAVMLDGRDPQTGFDHNDPASWQPSMQMLAKQGIKILGSPLWMLLSEGEKGQIVPSAYAIEAKAAGIKLIAWTLERSGSLVNGGGWYYQGVNHLIQSDGDTLKVLNVLAQDVGVIGVFSDWPGTTTYYANCVDIAK